MCVLFKKIKALEKKRDLSEFCFPIIKINFINKNTSFKFQNIKTLINYVH